MKASWALVSFHLFFLMGVASAETWRLHSEGKEIAVKDKERIPVYIRIENGKTICICHAGMKGCNHKCEHDLVTRDIFCGWQGTMKRNRYGI